MYKPWKKIHKTMPAPPYFREMKDLIDKVKEETAKMLRVDKEWLDEQEGKHPQELRRAIKEFAKRENWGEYENYKIRFLLNSPSVFVKYAWTRFIAEHINDEWGKVEPDLLTYDEEKDEIVMRWFVSRARKATRKIIKPIRSIFIPKGKGKFVRKIIK